jgi:hypothetical protein
MKARLQRKPRAANNDVSGQELSRVTAAFAKNQRNGSQFGGSLYDGAVVHIAAYRSLSHYIRRHNRD